MSGVGAVEQDPVFALVMEFGYEREPVAETTTDYDNVTRGYVMESVLNRGDDVQGGEFACLEVAIFIGRVDKYLGGVDVGCVFWEYGEEVHHAVVDSSAGVAVCGWGEHATVGVGDEVATSSACCVEIYEFRHC
jgi:hypothetical protein